MCGNSVCGRSYVGEEGLEGLERRVGQLHRDHLARWRVPRADGLVGHAREAHDLLGEEADGLRLRHDGGHVAGVVDDADAMEVHVVAEHVHQRVQRHREVHRAPRVAPRGIFPTATTTTTTITRATTITESIVVSEPSTMALAFTFAIRGRERHTADFLDRLAREHIDLDLRELLPRDGARRQQVGKVLGGVHHHQQRHYAGRHTCQRGSGLARGQANERSGLACTTTATYADPTHRPCR